MSEHPNNNRVVLENINWREAFPFTNLFRTFRIAIHPSKLGFALVGVLLCFIGGWFLDLIAGKTVIVENPSYTLRMPADEIQKYISSATMVEFDQWQDATREKNKKFLVTALINQLGESKETRKLIQDGNAMDHLTSAIETQRSKARQILAKRFEQTEKTLTKKYQDERKTAKDKAAVDAKHELAMKKLMQARDYLRISIEKSSRIAGFALQFSTQQAASLVIQADPTAKDSSKEIRDVREDKAQVTKTIAMADTYDRIKASEGLGVFQSALSYGILMFNSAVDSVLDIEFYKNPAFKSFVETPEEPPGLVNTLGLSLMGLSWLIRVHWLYFIVYFVFCVAIWAIAGGAICRIAALQATRDEKIPFVEAFRFAIQKFISFFTSPLMPLLFIVGCSVPLLITGLIGAIPGIGELIVGLGFILVLLISVALALVIIGGIGGFGLLFPTIAVEGSDTFDAFSRSYNYVYGQPWRTIFYTLVTAIYGTLCFVFVKLFVSLIFTTAYTITGWTMNLSNAAYAAPLGKLQAMWFGPSFSGPFFGRFYLFPLGWSENLGSAFIAFWVFLLVGLVIAFAISFFFSGYTMIYLLLRRVVDATEMDEIYVEEFETQIPEVPIQADSVSDASDTTSPEPEGV